MPAKWLDVPRVPARPGLGSEVMPDELASPLALKKKLPSISKAARCPLPLSVYLDTQNHTFCSRWTRLLGHTFPVGTFPSHLGRGRGVWE